MALVMGQATQGAVKLRPFVTTVNAVEKSTGIDFYAGLPDDVETRLERSSPDERWELDRLREPSSH